MSPAHATGPVGHSVLEVVGRILAPALCRRVLADALGRAQTASVPEDPWEARQFIEGPLAEAISDAVGPETASFVLDDLAPILALATSGVRRSPITRPAAPEEDAHDLPTFRPDHFDPHAFDAPADPHAAPTNRPESFDVPREALDPDQIPTAPPPDSGVIALPADRPHVLVATTSATGEASLTLALGGLARVSRVTDAYQLFTALDTRTAPVWMVVDGHRPAVDLSTLAVFLPRLPAGCQVLLWGFGESELECFTEKRGWTGLDVEDDFGALADELARRASPHGDFAAG